MELFTNKIQLDLPDADVVYHPQFIPLKEADTLFKKLYNDTPWRQDDIKVYGKVYAQPRLTALYASNSIPYSYSNITMTPEPFTPVLTEIKKLIEASSQTVFTTCLLNLYRDGKDSNGWHSDDEKELGQNPVIASLSLGDHRVFKMRKRDEHQINTKINLAPGSLLIMKGQTQHTWQHQIPKTSKNVGPRINLTFRVLI